MGILIIIGLGLYAVMFLLVRNIKNVSQIRKSVYLILPNIFMMAGLLFLHFYNSTFLPPKLVQSVERIDTLDKAESRIRELEYHSNHVEIYLQHSRREMFLLVGFLGLMFLIPLFVIAIGIAKPLEETKIIEENLT